MNTIQIKKNNYNFDFEINIKITIKNFRKLESFINYKIQEL